MKQPLCLNIVRDPAFTEGLAIARNLYGAICRDSHCLTDVKSSVSVYYTESTLPEDNMLDIDISVASRVAVLLLVDRHMYDDHHDRWESYINSLVDVAKRLGDSIRLYPVAFHGSAITAFPSLESKNFIRAYGDNVSLLDAGGYIEVAIKHELCRMLFGLERASDAGGPADHTSAPVQMFLSHTKHDENVKKFTEDLKGYIDSQTTGIQDFFDAVDIEPGTDFPSELRKGIGKSSVLIVMLSDSYAESEWCKREVLVAKRADLPILVVDCLEKGERRSFPYLGNTRTIRVNTKSAETCPMVVSSALSLVLERESHVRSCETILGAIGRDDVAVVRNAPELITKPCENVAVYPEPPVGVSEMALIEEVRPGAYFTPVDVLTNEGEVDLTGTTVAISASECDSAAMQGITINHIRAVALELSRYLIRCGAQVAYGGDINYETNADFTDALIEAFRAYNRKLETGERRQKLKNYVAGYLAEGITDEQREKLFPDVELIACAKHDGEGSRAADLSDMRKRMAEETDARIIIGGKTTGYQGDRPGVLEEALLFVHAGKPLYVVGAFGGVAGEIASYLMGQGSGEFKEQIRSWDLSILNNGLSPEENRRLLQSRNESEIVALVLRGLNK